MTPARFDLLCLLRTIWIESDLGSSREGKNLKFAPYRNQASLTQRTLVKRLALHPSTVSKMLKRLREMGWVTVERDYGDRRVKIVEATPLGLRRIWEAMRRVFRGRLLMSRFESVHRVLRPSVHVLHALDETRDLLWHLTACLGDPGNVDYSYGTKRYVVAPRFA